MATASADVAHPVPSLPPRVRYAFGLIGLLIGLAGLAAAIARPYIAEALKPPEPPPQKLSDKLAEVGDKFVGRMIDRVRGAKPAPVAAQPAPPPRTPWPWYLSVAAASLGFVAAVSGTAGWVRREDHRLAASAITAGFLAVAWVYIVMALVIALVIVFLLILLGALGG
jgi:hypothetical protein